MQTYLYIYKEVNTKIQIGMETYIVTSPSMRMDISIPIDSNVKDTIDFNMHTDE